mmetsp:Transcript_5720/g.11096  ORF Transcript_5720/g.11096 Transcript_5720/m.11096 type:complete len:461 (-) Transcript_5720:510-1892(-)
MGIMGIKHSIACWQYCGLSPVSVPHKVEVEMQDAAIECTLEASLVAVLPLLVDNAERDVLVGGSGAEPNDLGVLVLVVLEPEGWSLGLVNQIRIEDIELVALHHLGGGVVVVVVRLVVLVPLVTRVHSVEEARLAGPVLVVPRIHLLVHIDLSSKGNLIISHTPPCLLLIQSIVHVGSRQGVLRRRRLELVALLLQNIATLSLDGLLVTLRIYSILPLIPLIQHRTVPPRVLVVTVVVLLHRLLLRSRLIPLARLRISTSSLVAAPVRLGLVRHRLLGELSLKGSEALSEDARVNLLELGLGESCLELREHLLGELGVENLVVHRRLDLLLLLLELRPAFAHKGCNNVFLNSQCRAIYPILHLAPLISHPRVVQLVLAHQNHGVPELSVCVVERTMLFDISLKFLQGIEPQVSKQLVGLRHFDVGVVADQVLGEDVDGLGPALGGADLGSEARLLEVELV